MSTMAFSVIREAAERLEKEDSPTEARRIVSRIYCSIHDVTWVLRIIEEPIPNVKYWLDRMKDVCFDVMDVSEEMMLQEAKEVRLLGLRLSLLNPLPQLKAHNKMQAIRHKLKDLLREGDKYAPRLEELPPPPFTIELDPPLEASSFALKPDVNIFGRYDEMETLIDMLLNEGGQEQDIQCIAIVGIDGLGKTTLAQLVYNRAQVLQYFDLLSWVSVPESSESGARRIAKAIVKSLTSKSADEVIMTTILRQIIEGKRCLFVLDDVWLHEHSPDWRDLKSLLNCSAPGSRILITSPMNSDGPPASNDPYTMSLRPLSDEDIWTIIRKHAFGPSIDEATIEMIYNEVGTGIANKCRGVPLIAKSLGSMMRGRNSIQQWQQVLSIDVWDLGYDLMSSFKLIYSLMSSELKLCLLYCSIFPANHSIDVDKLIKLWMAQGFLGPDHDEMERNGWKCFRKLLDLSFFQQFKLDGNGNFKCRWVSPMSKVVQDLTENELHMMFLDSATKYQNNYYPWGRRHCTLNVAAQDSLPAYFVFAFGLHTLMILSEYSSIDPANLPSLLSDLSLRRVRALGLSSCSIKELPLKVGEFLHLRYLDLSFNDDLKKLPQTICNLFHLQTLNLNGCSSLRKLPKRIGKLINLRHLEILWTTSLTYLPKGIASLTTLRTLNRFFGSSGAGSRACSLGDLEKLNNIQGCITVDGLGGETSVSEAEKAGLKNKEGLRGLELWFSIVGSESNDQHVLEALEAPPQLQGLGIFYYRGESLPNWVTALDKLTHLRLADCSNCNIQLPLWNLPSLKSLEIKNMPQVKKLGPEFLGITSDDADGGKEGFSSTVAFPKLEKLCFEMLNNWEEWVGIHGDGLHANIMPSLTSLSIKSCAKIRAVPDYIESKKDLIPTIDKCPYLKRL